MVLTVGTTPKERGLIFRQAVNQSINTENVEFEHLGDNHWLAVVAFVYSPEYFSNKDEFGLTRYADSFEIYFTPDKLDYNGVHVFNIGYPWRIDWKTYRWAVYKLSEYMVMEKLSDGLE